MLEHVKPSSLMIGYIHGGKVDDVFLQSLMNFRDLDDRNLKLRHSFCSARGPFHEANRNKVVAFMMERKEVEWLLFVDTDIQFEASQPYALLAQADPIERPIVSGLYFGQPGEITDLVPIWYKLNDAQEYVIQTRLDGMPLQKLDGCGMGFCLIHRSVFARFPDPGHDWRWFARDPYPVNGKLQHLGEDLSFCDRASRQMGIPIYGHRGVAVKHHKERVEDLDAFLKQAGVVDRLRVSQSQSSVAAGDGAVVQFNNP